MRKVTKILIGFILSLFLCVSSFAQNKIAVIDKNVCEDEKVGIRELVVANKKLESEFKFTNDELKILNDKAYKIIGEMETLQWAKYPKEFDVGKELKKKLNEYEELSEEINSKVGEWKVLFGKRKSELVEPVFKRVVEKLEVFKKNKGYLVVLDKSKLNDGAIIIEDEPDDITNEFIKFCNEEFEKEKGRK